MPLAIKSSSAVAQDGGKAELIQDQQMEGAGRRSANRCLRGVLWIARRGCARPHPAEIQGSAVPQRQYPHAEFERRSNRGRRRSQWFRRAAEPELYWLLLLYSWRSAKIPWWRASICSLAETERVSVNVSLRGFPERVEATVTETQHAPE